MGSLGPTSPAIELAAALRARELTALELLEDCLAAVDARNPELNAVVWRDDEQGLQPLLAGDAAGTRGKGVKARGSGGPAAKLASWLRGLPGVDAVTLEAFPVEPASGP